VASGHAYTQRFNPRSLFIAKDMAHLEGSLDRSPTLVCEFLFAIEVKWFVALTTTNWKVMSVLIPMKEL
jgi:hypothetical protein